MYNKAEILLTITIGGRQFLRRIGDDTTMEEQQCTVVTKLGSQFSAYAISDDARPEKLPHRVWNGMSHKNRLIWHTRQYVRDVYGPSKFTFKIMM